MNCLATFVMIMATIASEKPEDNTLEWTLSYMERDIPEGAKEDLEEASDYAKHKNDFRERASVTIITNGLTASLAKSKSKSGALVFSIVPSGDEINLYGVFQPELASSKKTIIVTSFIRKKIKYGEEKELGGGAHAKKDHGQLFKGKARVFILVVRKTNSSIPELAEQSVEIKGRTRKEKGKEKGSKGKEKGKGKGRD